VTDPRYILFLQSSSELYGSGKILLQVLGIYRSQGFVPVVILPGEGDLAESMRAEGFIVKIKNLGILRRKYVNPKGLINRLQRNIQAYIFLNQLHRQYQFQLVYSNTLAVIIGSIWAKNHRIPHCWHIHEILLGPTILIQFLVKLLDSSTPIPIAVSESVALHWRRFLKKSKPEVIHNGIPYDQFLSTDSDAKSKLNLPQDRLVITMVGRINPGKGQVFFLEVARELVLDQLPVHFVLVGDPYPGYESILEEIEKKINDFGLSEHVTNLGFRLDIPEILAASDLFVLPSTLPDSFPTVILEAMASGLPVIASVSGGACEMVVAGETGFLFPISEGSSAVSALRTLIENQELRKKMGQAARSRVINQYSLEAFETKIKSHLWQHLKTN
jgi:glycosyltransferase involved in cell wall biosynthesis